MDERLLFKQAEERVNIVCRTLHATREISEQAIYTGNLKYPAASKEIVNHINNVLSVADYCLATPLDQKKKTQLLTELVIRMNPLSDLAESVRIGTCDYRTGLAATMNTFQQMVSNINSLLTPTGQNYLKAANELQEQDAKASTNRGLSIAGVVGSVIGLGIAAAIATTIALTPLGWGLLTAAAIVLVAGAGASAIGIVGTTQEKKDIETKLSSLQHDGVPHFTFLQQERSIPTVTSSQAHHQSSPSEKKPPDSSPPIKPLGPR